MIIKYYPEAINDISEIELYFRVNYSEKRKNSIIDSLFSAIEGLKLFPYKGLSIQALTGNETDLYMLISGNYAILYVVCSNEVHIKRILDSRRIEIQTLLL